MSRLIFLFISIITIPVINAQNAIYVNNDAILYLNNKVNTTDAVLRINGNAVNNNGTITNNNSLIEITGNWTNAVTTNAYISTGIERFTGNNDQQINGVWNGTTLNKNQLFDVEILKSSASGQTISLNTNTHVNSTGTLKFTDNYGIIRTDANSHGNNGALYPYYLFLQNPDPSSLSGNSWTGVSQWANNGGATTKYIEGKLKRSVSSNNTYNFPVGVAPTSLDGLEGISVSFTNTFSTTALLAYLQPAAQSSYTNDLITNGGNLFYDIGGLPGVAPANQFPNCVSGPDGHNDLAVIDNAVTHEWILTADAPTSNYNLNVYPGPVLDNLTYVQMGTPCNTLFPKAKYLARNGRIGGDEAAGPTTDSANIGITGLYQKPTGNKLSGQTSFSRFRLFGVTNPNNTTLPVELISLTATVINNTYIRIDWATASEFNNRGFVLQRSTDGSHFDSIAWINGNGTTNVLHNYTYNDLNVQPNITYYFRLKQVDNNGNFVYSNIVAAKITITTGVNNNNNQLGEIIVFPNPITSATVVQLLPYYDGNYELAVYDDLGRVVEHTTVETKAKNSIRVPVASQDWPKGMYILRITNEKNQSNTFKLIKQ